MHNMKPISIDASDDFYHFPTPWLAGIYSSHFLLRLQQKENDPALQKDTRLQPSMTIQTKVK